MYLTRMELDTSQRKTIMALASPALFHGAIEHDFAGKGRKLWRRDTLLKKSYLLLVSETPPELTTTSQQFGTENGWETLDYESFLAHIRVGQRRHFRLKANPVIAKSAGMGKRGKVLAHVTVAQQAQWLIDRAEKHGFHLEPDEFAVTQTAWESFRKNTDGGRRVTFRTAVFEGTLTVTDAQRFRQALVSGIGREKAYGCGLLTVTRCVE
ncbi:MAG: type I-E CRISPR-associated protein Cas6/Cse3/CasE [Clostridiales bacterium]|nr:type I-E CRISPR-associated protein Cas6/Cse3/CasE [Candidatus Cacconaster stercorequi]